MDEKIHHRYDSEPKYEIGTVVKVKRKVGKTFSGKVGVILSQEHNWGMNGYVIGYYVMIAGDPVNQFYFREDELDAINVRNK